MDPTYARARNFNRAMPRIAAASASSIGVGSAGTGAVTVRVAAAAAPSGVSGDVTADVVFTRAPAAVPRTLTLIVHD